MLELDEVTDWVGTASLEFSCVTSECVLGVRTEGFLQGADSCGIGDGSKDPSKEGSVFHLSSTAVMLLTIYSRLHGPRQQGTKHSPWPWWG